MGSNSDSPCYQATPEDQIGELYAATRRLMTAENRSEVATIAVETATAILDFPFSVFWEATDSGLKAEAISEPLREHVEVPAEPGRRMRHERGSWLWDHYESDETQRVLVDEEKAASDAPLHGCISVPLPEYGLLTAGTDERAEPTERETQLADILGKNVLSTLERIERERELKRQRDNLDLLNQIVRHDLTNHLQTISGRAELLRDQCSGDALEHADGIQESSQAAAELLETAGNLATVMRQTDWETEPVALGPVLSSVSEDIAATYSDAQVTVPDESPSVRVRADELLSSVFRNVLTNAIQHNDSAVPSVVIDVIDDGDVVHVTVADDGPGIPDEQKQAVFERGEKRLDSDGTGVGLYLVRTLVDAYGGDVWVEDNEPTGTVVGVTLRKAAGDA
ncbi:signal transduction protein [Haloarcula hispanica N601]|uniref:histidine kinase n=2 Tax=Haloarcula hispanica TaxID=51589 RepID=V5TIA0_HALHI|nr:MULTISPECIES: HAMP domain-containing sensor histidine kinase [Haloarcula]AEM56229.1 signal-transducing histidine kinase [Haloarcula hispanica ATCC 33960]AHB65041.1 signal transduction protein [Haloarcula hispanica N601]KZX47910.1 signal transduction protein [Haloarcula sp. K1]